MIKSKLKFYKDFEKRFKIKFDKPVLRKHTNGFLSISLDWSTKKADNPSRFKYVKLQHTMYGGDTIVAVAFSFTDLEDKDTSNMPSWFEVGITTGREKDSYNPEFQYEYVGEQLTKYGVIVWFGLRGWEEWDKAEIL